MGRNLQESLSYFSDKITDAIKSKKSILVTTHIDCDGITSGSIISKALIRQGANCTVRTTNEFIQNLIESMKKENKRLHVITDLGGGFGKYLDEKIGDNWIVLDHHQIPEEEMENQNVINAWKFDIDGGKEISAGGMAYLASLSLNKENKNLQDNDGNTALVQACKHRNSAAVELLLEKNADTNFIRKILVIASAYNARSVVRGSAFPDIRKLKEYGSMP